jgi:uncharacterized membrane protein
MTLRLRMLLVMAIPLALSFCLIADAAPVVSRVVLVTGRDDLLLPAAAIANLDAPSRFVAGTSRWDHDGDGVVFNETHVTFLWSEAGGIQVAPVGDELYFEPNRHFPAAIARDGAVVGADLFTEMFKAFPYVFVRDTFQILPLPCRGAPLDTLRALRLSQCTGFATGVSDDGRVVVGTAQIGEGFFPPTRAVVWKGDLRSRRPRYTVASLAAPPDGSSNAYAVSADGVTIAGDAGPDPFTLSAVRWVNDTLQPLEPVGTSSSALFLARDGSAAIGWAFLEDGSTVLVRWDSAGAALAAAPPGGTSVVTIAAINATATAAVGAGAFNGNQAPYVWTLDGGFTILPELGRESDYDLSEALGVSADGRSVVGAIQASVVSNGDPPARGFLWTADGGLVVLDDLLSAAGFADAGIFTAGAISSDGRRILATGNPPRTDRDTNSVVIELGP